MIPRTFPSTLNPITGQRQLVALFLNNITGLNRWVDYIPVNFGKGTTLVEGRYDNNGFIAIQEITSGIGLIPFEDYVPVFFDASATDTWQVSDVGFIPYGASGSSVAPALDLVFTRSNVLDSRITFTRSTTATYTGSDGLIQTAAINAPRFDYDPVTLASKGLLIEEQRVNLFLRSNEFTTSPWVLSPTSQDYLQTAVSPSGATDAWVLSELAITGQRTTRQDATSSATLVHTGSVYVKALPGSNQRYVGLRVADAATSSANYGNAVFNLVTGAWATAPTNVGLSTGATGSITPCGNGWYRITLSCIPSTSGTSVRLIIGTSNSPSNSLPSYLGQVGSGVIIYGSQLEAGAFATSYIPTVASQVTRAFDLAVMTGTNFSSWYNATEGTFIGTLSTAVNGNVGTQVRTLLCPHDGTANNLFYFGRGAVNNQIRAFASVAGAVQLGAAGITIANVFATNLATISMAYKTDSYAITGAGLTPTNATPPNLVPTVNQMTIGCFRNFTATSIINGHIQRITYYPLRLANAELQAATA